MTAGTEVGVCMLPGGTFMLSVHQAFEGHYFAAAIGIVAILPWGKLAAAIKFADGEINLSKPVVEALQWMTPAERAALDARVAGNMTITEGEKILANLSNGALREVGTLRPVEQVTAGRLQDFWAAR